MCGAPLILENMLIALDAGQQQAGACLPNVYDVSALSIHRD